MASICDSCGEKFTRDSGSAHLRVSPPRVSFKLLQALVTAGRAHESHDPLELDLCLACTRTTLTHLKQPTDVCDLPEVPPSILMTDPPDGPNIGALTDEDLRQLGLVDPQS